MSSRQTELMAISENRTEKRYRFYLQNTSGGLKKLRHTPGGWETGKYELQRNEKYMGLFRKLSFNELTFVKDGRDYIRDVYEAQGINAVIVFTVQRWNDSTGAYGNYFIGKIDLSTYTIDETGVRVQVIDSSFSEKIKNRESMKVNIRERVSVNGYEVPAFSDETPSLFLPAYVIYARASWAKRVNMDSTLDNHYVPLLIGTSEFTEAQSQNPDTVISDGNAMFENSLADRTILIEGHISGGVYYNIIQPHPQFTIKIYVNGVAVHTIGTVSGTSTNYLGFDFDFSTSISVLTGQDFWIQGTLSHSGETVYDQDIAVTISEQLESVSQATITAYPYYEALLRVCQLIGDGNDVLQSEFFGRTDSEVVTYDQDGEIGHVTRGLFIRNTYSYNDSLALSLVDLFDSLAAIYQIGLGVEEVDGVEKVVIEALDYFFDSTVVLDLSSRIREAGIAKEVIAQRHFSQVEAGYNSFEYETVGGLAEFNTKMLFSTVISVLDNKLDLICKYRGDTTGIIQLRQTGTDDKDSKGDEDVYVIDSLRRTSPFTGFQARTNEGFTLVTGGADAENSLNLRISPKRNLLRHGQLIRAGLEKNLGTYLRWQSGDKNTTLATKLTTETDMLAENADVLVNDLARSFFVPEFYTVECEMRYSDLSAILANNKGLIKLSSTKYGWIWNLSFPEGENKVTLKLLKADLNVVTPTS